MKSRVKDYAFMAIGTCLFCCAGTYLNVWYNGGQVTPVTWINDGPDTVTIRSALAPGAQIPRSDFRQITIVPPRSRITTDWYNSPSIVEFEYKTTGKKVRRTWETIKPHPATFEAFQVHIP